MRRIHRFLLVMAVLGIAFEQAQSQGADIPEALALDNADNTFIAGSSMDAAGRMDLIVLGYSANGHLLGVQKNQPPVSGSAIAGGVIVSGSNVLFTGTIPDSTGKYVMITGSIPRASLLGVEPPSQAPADFTLEQSYPNPLSNGSTVATITYALARSDVARLFVADENGGVVAVLVDERKEAGRYETVFNPATLPSGAYYYTLQLRSGSITRKLLVAR